MRQSPLFQLVVTELGLEAPASAVAVQAGTCKGGTSLISGQSFVVPTMQAATIMLSRQDRSMPAPSPVLKIRDVPTPSMSAVTTSAT